MKRIFIITILFAVSAIAQNKTLTLKECVQLGMENSNELKISKAKLIGSDAKVTEANSHLLPQLKFQASYQRLSNIPAGGNIIGFPSPANSNIADNFK